MMSDMSSLLKELKEKAEAGDENAMKSHEELLKLLKKEEELVDKETELTEEEQAALAKKPRSRAGSGGETGGDSASGSGTGFRGGSRGSSNGGGIFSSMKKGYDKVNDPFVAFQENVSKQVANTAAAVDETAHPYAMAIFALVLHVFDFLSPMAPGNFDRGATHGSLMFIAYALFALWAALFYYRTGLTKSSLRFFSISLVAFFLPYVLHIPFIGELKYVPTLIALLPVWFLSISQSEEKDSLLHKLGTWWIYGLVIILFIIVIGRFSMPELFVSSGVNVGDDLRGFFDDFTEQYEDIKLRFVRDGFFCVNCWQEKIDRTLNPYLPYYAGVQENQEEPTGVFVTAIRSLLPVYYVGSSVDPEVIASIEAKSFIPGGVRITPSCRLERGKHYFGGLSDPPPNEPIILNRRLFRDVTCTYPWSENMTRGTYSAVVGLSFPYETWSYVTLTFVSQSLIEQYYQQGRDINRDLEIPSTAEAIYTNGPVELGLTSDRQPIDIDLDATSPSNLIQQRFGFTIANRWPQGEVKEVRGVTIMVPKPFVLNDCAPVGEPSITESESYRNYTFDKINEDGSDKLDPYYDYSTVYCQLDLPDVASAQQLLAYGEKTPVTFVVIARYVYTMEEKTRLKIEDLT
jgi:hypothetical protein